MKVSVRIKVGGRSGIYEKYTYDATNVRLRQFTVGYQFKFDKVDWLDNINLSLVGSNLFWFYKDMPGDPDMTISTGNGGQSMENFALPPTRSYGFNGQENATEREAKEGERRERREGRQGVGKGEV